MSSARRPEVDDAEGRGAEARGAVAAALLAAPKYRHVAPGVIERIARESLAAAPRASDAIKRAKSKLHQIHSAFVAQRDLAAVERLLAQVPPDVIDLRGWEPVCASILERHASTAERARPPSQPESPGRATLYRDLFALTGPPASVLDLGCGLHPFALPWMGLARDTPYHAVDLDRRIAALVDGFFGRIGQRGGARASDLLGDEPLPAADTALLMKLLPTLERQQSGAAGRLLARLADQGTRAFVLSFPTASLGRREKGMAARYEAFARSLIDGLEGRRRVTLLTARTELFLVATLPSAMTSAAATPDAPRRER